MSSENLTAQNLSSRGRANVQTIIPNIPPSILKGHVDDVVDLSTAENWVVRDRMAELSRDAITQRLKIEHLSWPAGFYGMPQLLEAIAKYMNDTLRLARPIGLEDVTTLPGAIGCIMSLLWNICEQGDGIIIPTPYWFGFDTFAQVRAGVRIVEARVPDLKDAMTPRLLEALEVAFETSSVPIKALLISNPHNPIGRPWSAEMLQAMLQFCQDKNIHFISDEVFSSVDCTVPNLQEGQQVPQQNGTRTPQPVPFTSVLELDAESMGCDDWRIHTIWSPSKLFGLTGLRIGAVISRSNPDLRNGLALSTMQEISVTSSLIALHLLTSPQLPSVLAVASSVLSEHYRLLKDALNELSIEFMPCRMALSVLAKVVPHAKSPADEKDFLAALKKEGVMVGSGLLYKVPEPGWARITFAVERHKLLKGIEGLRRVILLKSGSSSGTS